ncbi:MAG: universal stress protein [Betaproteobacteria bacterium]|nr:universal stress protein [Betaproteobacteria bacterium]
MTRILIPVLDSVNSGPAVRHVIDEFLHGELMEVQLLHLPASPTYRVAHWLLGKNGGAADKALQSARDLLERVHVPCAVHSGSGNKALAINAAAQRLKTDRIVLGTARHWSATRMTEDSVIQEVLDTAPVPVTLVAGKAVSRVEQYGVAAGLGATLWLILVE